MSKTYEQKKAYCERRARELAATMEAAIETGNDASFRAAYAASRRYLTKKQRMPLYIRYLERRTTN